MVKVELKSLDGQQVDGNGIARESIHGQEIKMLRWLAFQRQTRVAQFNRNVRSRIPQKTEVLLCEVHNQGVDIVESVVVPRPPVRRDGTHAEANDTDAQRAARTQGPERYANSGIRGVVGSRLIRRDGARNCNPWLMVPLVSRRKRRSSRSAWESPLSNTTFGATSSLSRSTP